jgi:hypothetical protein
LWVFALKALVFGGVERALREFFSSPRGKLASVDSETPKSIDD